MRRTSQGRARRVQRNASCRQGGLNKNPTGGELVQETVAPLRTPTSFMALWASAPEAGELGKGRERFSKRTWKNGVSEELVRALLALVPRVPVVIMPRPVTSFNGIVGGILLHNSAYAMVDERHLVLATPLEPSWASVGRRAEQNKQADYAAERFHQAGRARRKQVHPSLPKCKQVCPGTYKPQERMQSTM